MNNFSPSSSSGSTPHPISTTAISGAVTTTILDLPQQVLIHIISFLYLPEAILTSLICRSFRNLWHSIPSLHFDIYEFYSRNQLPNPRSDYSRRVFVEFVHRTLNFRLNNPLTKLQLTFEYTNFDEHKFDVQSWIRKAINLSVSEVILEFEDIDQFDLWDDPDDADKDDGSRLCTFQFHLLDVANSCIKVFKLDHCDLRLPPKTNPVIFVCLKSLELETVNVYGNTMCSLFAQCVNLETLKLVDMEFGSDVGLRIYSDSLKELYLDRCWSGIPHSPLELDICCPRLSKISLTALHVGKYTIKDTKRLVEAWVDFWSFFEVTYTQIWEGMLSYFTNISTLHVWDELLESNEVPPGCEQFASNVKHLELYCSYNGNDLVGVAALLKLFPKLEILGLRSRGRGKVDKNLHRYYRKASTVFNMPCLKKVILRSYHNTKRERHFIKLFRKSGIVLEKIELLPSSKEEDY